MLVKNDYVAKHDVVFVKENDTKQTVFKKLNDSGYRCIPVLDEDKKTFVGNIYKVHLLEYEKNYGKLDGTVKELIKNKNGHAKEDDPFFTVFSLIKQLPYLAIVDENKTFLGILTNGNVIQVLENAWGANNGSYSLTIGTIEYSGALQKMLRVVNKHCNVQSVISLNNNSNYVRRVCIVLPMEVDEALMKKVCDDLDKNNFTVTDIETLN
ncbi:cyclic di-AMP binding protein CbpA [Virgibacillus halophilus]|uniref:Cyclic di-AMP binding protein CbpA n=1 Tax=Tigheibacillus halophilus TaxID=361280 RepID=A0ABU5C5T6_9BACI|nr:cyclic di-AMP binding protein CbpA [Virgibacillus halophilus]